MNRRLPVVLALLCVSAGPAAPQSISDRFERLFGPPVSSDGSAPARRPQASRPETPPEPAAAEAPAADEVPLPTARPAEPASDAPAPDGPAPEVPALEEATETPDDPAGVPAVPDEPASAPETASPEGPPESVDTDAVRPEPAVVPDAVPSEPAVEAVPVPEPAPPGPTEASEDAMPDGRPEETVSPESTAETPAEDDEGETPETSVEDDAGSPPPPPPPSPPPPPAYVSPEKARTEPEPAAPTTPAAGATPEESVEAAAAVEDARTCEAELEARGAEFTVEPSISEGDCGVLRPVQMTRSSAGIAVEPATQMLCRTALAFDIWVSEGLVPAAESVLDAAPPETIRHASTYVCRPRASESSISEHARGSAIDIASIEWGDRDPIVVEKQAPGSPEDRFLADIRRAACGPFKTVIGPGTDADHSDHFHFDIAARSNDSTYCR